MLKGVKGSGISSGIHESTTGNIINKLVTKFNSATKECGFQHI